MDQHVTTANTTTSTANTPDYYTSALTIIPTPSTSSNLIYTQDPQYHVPYPSQPQYIYNTMENQNMIHPGPYQSIDFFYETPQQPGQIPQPQPQQQQDMNFSTTTTNYQIPTTRTTERSTSTTQSSVDDDYVQNLANELQHTKQLLSQYQLRTEQLMNLVEKQTTKINELREQLQDNKKL